MAYQIVSGDDMERAALEMLGETSGYVQVVSGDESNLQDTLKAKGAVLVKTDMDFKAREFPLGFDSGATLIPAGGTVTINSQPQIPFRCERIVIPSDIAGGFVVEDFMVGKNSQFANDQPVPGRIFAENAVGVRLRTGTAQVSQNVVLRVTNTTGAPLRFRAAVIGTALDM